MVLLLAACAFRPPAETPALVAAAGPVQTVPLPPGEPVRVALRAGSAHDPPGREGLAWVTAHAVAAAAGAEVEVGPEVVVYTASADGLPALARALAAPPTAERVADARASAVLALSRLDCRALAERAWDAWIYAAHPYGHAPEGRISVLPTLTPAEVAAFQEVRYVRSVAVVGVPEGAAVDLSLFESLPPRLSRSPVPSVRLPLPDARVLVVTSEGQRCLVAGHPEAADAPSGRAVEAFLAGPDASVASHRRQPRRLVASDLAPDLDIAARVAEVLGGGLPSVQAGPARPPEAGLPSARVLGDELLAMHPWPSLAHPVGSASGAAAADVATSPEASTPDVPLDTLLAAWLTPAEVRAVVVLPPGDTASLESLSASGVQGAVHAQELLR